MSYPILIKFAPKCLFSKAGYFTEDIAFSGPFPLSLYMQNLVSEDAYAPSTDLSVFVCFCFLFVCFFFNVTRIGSMIPKEIEVQSALW